jgi:hypothetical protein
MFYQLLDESRTHLKMSHTVTDTNCNEKNTKTLSQNRLLCLSFRIQGDSRVIMSLTKFVMQPTIHVLHKTKDCKVLLLFHMILIKFDKCNIGYDYVL